MKGTNPLTMQKVFLAILVIFTGTLAQNCDNTGVSALTSDVSSLPAALSGASTQSAFTIDLTEATSGSFGGLFLDSATAFQGQGGFSAKFSIANTGANSGDAWEFIIAGEGNMAFSGPPYGPGESSYQLAGWSRLNSLVIEFDAFNSGTSEQDSNSDHISVFLAGVEETSCQYSLPDETKLSDGVQYTFWIDFSGFNTQLDIRMGTDASTRPAAAIASCPINIWGTLDISSTYHAGFGGYNSNSGDNDATILSLAENFYISDARRPADTDTCAVYDSCSTKDSPGLCSPASNTPDTCTLQLCGNALQWDASGDTCCSFVERGSFQADEVTGANSVGDDVACSFKRNTIPAIAESSLCDSEVETPVASPSSSPAASGISESPSPSPLASATPAAVPSVTPSPSPSPSVLCGDVCGDLVSTLDCSLDTLAADIAAAQAIPCIDDTSGVSRTCACSGFDASALVGGDEADTTDNTDVSNCIADSIQATGPIRTGSYSNVFINTLLSDANSGIFIENDISKSKICTLEGENGKVLFGSVAISDTTINTIHANEMDQQASSSYTNVNFEDAVNISFGTGMKFTVDSAGNGGTITYSNVQFNNVVVLGGCSADAGVTVDIDGASALSGLNIFISRDAATCPSIFDA